MSSLIEHELKVTYSDCYHLVIAGSWAIFHNKNTCELVWIYCLCQYSVENVLKPWENKLTRCWGEDTKFIAENGIIVCPHCRAAIPNRIHLLARLIRVGS